ncbi:uroplakin-3b isoform X2 [Dromaius novaehollandiae]|uniref:uroplakin-3b isoform X2 n=1 Tax=Dromaius novaehollandiae TaxID=8790 RepID=UPI0031200B67
MALPRVLLALAGTGAAAGLVLLPYVPRAPRQALAGKVTATTFALDKPFCVFDGYANATDSVWLAVAFANASAAFRNPASPAAVPPYGELRAALSYMTLETPASAYACRQRSDAVLRVGSDTACGAESGPAPCNGPLPSPGPYRVKFLALGPRGPTAETRWSEPIVLRRACSPGTLEPSPARRGSTTLVIASVLAGLGAALAVGLLGAVRAQLCRPRRRDPAAGSFARSSYRTHHIPPAPAPPGKACAARALR